MKVAPKIVRYYWPHPYAIGPHGHRKGKTWYGRRWTDVVVGYTYSAHVTSTVVLEAGVPQD